MFVFVFVGIKDLYQGLYKVALRQDICICICMDQRSVAGALQAGSEAGHLYLYLYLYGSKICIRGRTRLLLGQDMAVVI